MTTKAQVIAVKAEDGSYIRVSPNNAEQGSINVQSSTVEIDDLGWVREHKRSALIKGPVDILQKAVLPKIAKDGKLDGRIVITEITESQLNDPAYARHKKIVESWFSSANPTPSDEERLDNFTKRIFNDDKTESCNLTVNGERILRFQDFSTKSEDEKKDVILTHDNQLELAEFRAKYANA